VSDAPESAAKPANDAVNGDTDNTRPVSALLEILPHILRTLRREPALATSLTYLFVAMAGIFYNFSFYRQFDIPVLTLSQIGDFLVAGIQQPMALVLVLSTFPLCWVFDKINMRGRRRRAAEAVRLRALPQPSAWQRGRLSFIDWLNEKRWYTQLAYLVVIIAYGWTFVGAYAGHRADLVKRGDAAQVRIWMNGGSEALAPSGVKVWTYLGAIAEYVFVYDPKDGRAEILPVNAVARIEPVASAGSKDREFMVAPIP
jgi:hypothetical protein